MLMQDRREKPLKTRTNSRKGCANCKVRHVKCDETKPQCRRCSKSGIVCHYATVAATLSSLYERTSNFAGLTGGSLSSNQAILNNFNGAVTFYAGEKAYWLKMPDLERISRFLQRTLPASGPESIVQRYRSDITGVLTQHQHVLHAVLALTAMHDRYDAKQAYHQRTALEAYHFGMASRRFNEDLNKDAEHRSIDAIWITAAFMSWATIFTVETDDPDQVWPLKPADTTDLMWLEMQKGLRALWHSYVGAKGEAFCTDWIQEPGARCLGVALSPDGQLEDIVEPLRALCNINEFSNSSNNPYYMAAKVLSLLLKETQITTSTLRFLAFPNTIEFQFEALLRQRDPVALEMLCVWYSLAEKTFWWMSGRAMIERLSILIYLERFHPKYHEALSTFDVQTNMILS